MRAMQAELEASGKELRTLERTMHAQEGDLKALKHQLDERESQVSC